MTENKNPEKGAALPPTCAGCQRLQHLVDQIIKGSIDFLVTLKFGYKKLTPAQYAQEFERASFVFIQHLRDHGFLPKKTVPPSANGSSIETHH